MPDTLQNATTFLRRSVTPSIGPRTTDPLPNLTRLQHTRHAPPWHAPLWFIALAILGLTCRWPFLADPVPTLDSDEAVTGLMAMDIRDGAHPIYFYGQGYLGTLEAFTAAGIFTLFGASPLTLRMAPLLLFVLSLGFQFLVVKRWFGPHTARWSLLFMVLLPAPLALWTVKARGGFTAVFLLGMALVWTYQRAAHATGTPKKLWTFLAGVVLGLGWWTNPMIVFYVVPLAALLEWRLYRAQKSSTSPGHSQQSSPTLLRQCLNLSLSAGLGTLLGLAPVWTYRLAHNTLQARQLFDPDPQAWLSGWGLLAIDILPLLFDVGPLVLAALALPLLTWLAISAIKLAITSRAPDHTPSQTQILHREGLLFVAVMTLAVPLVAVLSNQLVDLHSFRYLLPILVPFSIALGLLCATGFNAGGWRRTAALALAGLWTLHCGQSLVRHRHQHLQPLPVQDILAAAQSNHLAALAVPYWQTYRLSFLTQRKLNPVPIDGISRDPQGKDRWQRFQNRAILSPSDQWPTLLALADSKPQLHLGPPIKIGQWTLAPIALKSPDNPTDTGQKLLTLLTQGLPQHQPPSSTWPPLQ